MPISTTSKTALENTIKELEAAVEEAKHALYLASHGRPIMHTTPPMRNAVACLTKAMCEAGTCEALKQLESKA